MPTRDRDALYYPYIRIHSQNWLKATLLCFPRVRRILPENFTPFDVPEVKAFTDLRLGPADPLPLLCGEIPPYTTQRSIGLMTSCSERSGLTTP